MVWIGISIIVAALVVFVSASERVKYGEFEDLSWGLISFGIYQWGQALVLVPVWMLFGLACMFWWTPVQAIQSYLLFHAVRALVELLMLHSGTYSGLLPLFKKQTHKLSDNQLIQLYSLGQAVIILVCLGLR